MNLLAFLFLVGCLTMVALAMILQDEAKELVKAITDRIRNPRPSALEELHRHWEVEDRIRRGGNGD